MSTESDRRERFAEERPLFVAAARALYERLGRGFSQSEWRRHARGLLGEEFCGGVTERAIAERFGRWPNFLRCAGVPSWGESVRSQERARSPVRAFETDFERVAGFLHRPPSRADYGRFGRYSHDPLVRHLDAFEEGGDVDRERSATDALSSATDPDLVAPYFARPFDASGPRKAEVRAAFFALLPFLPGRHYVDRVDADGASVIAVYRQGSYRLDVGFDVRGRSGDSGRTTGAAPRVIVCWESSADAYALSLKDYAARGREVGLDRLIDVLPERAFARVETPRPGPVPYFTRPPRNEAETLALSLALLPHFGRIRVLAVEARGPEEANFDLDLAIYFPRERTWRRCRTEAKFDARRFDKASEDQDLLICWSSGTKSVGRLPVLSFELYLGAGGFPGGPGLLEYLPELVAALTSNAKPLVPGRRA